MYHCSTRTTAFLLTSLDVCTMQQMLASLARDELGADKLITIKFDKQDCYLLSLEHREEVICIRHGLDIRVWLQDASDVKHVNQIPRK
uniref:Serine/threonine-protein phosphatase 5 n=1 Tax=Arundo donax TaxID=35708 RepID=A0A0A9GAT3_ARUDO